MPIKSIIAKIISGLSGNKEAQNADAPEGKISPLKLVFFIVDWDKAHFITDIFVEKHVCFHFVSMGMGTATSDRRNFLGIDGHDKALVICLEQAVRIPTLLKEARRKRSSSKTGAGIAFTISLSAINDPLLLVFNQSMDDNRTAAVAKEGEDMAHSAHDCIVAIVNQGYSDEFMSTARAAGASGGTMIPARGQAHEGAVKFFGIAVQDEKEMIFILSSREKKTAIMQAVSEAHGLNSKAHGIVFSLPVDDILGIDFE